ncbi:MAG: nucleotidyltransferase [Candidatus Omnitrophica bacterium]|nr:nucleotidyltransferase [Candidatus Omnitrophota bacterium]
MKYPTIFHLISTEFEKAEIPYVLIGGFAVNYYGVTRQTANVDLLITKENVAKALELLKRSGYKQGLMQEVFARLENNKTYLMDIDLMFVDKETLTRIIKDGKKIKIAGKRFVVPSLNHLIALKLHSIKFNPKIREFKDLPDIINLLRMNKVNVRTDRFRKLCLKYGTKELYRKILKNVERDT